MDGSSTLTCGHRSLSRLWCGFSLLPWPISSSWTGTAGLHHLGRLQIALQIPAQHKRGNKKEVDWPSATCPNETFHSAPTAPACQHCLHKQEETHLSAGPRHVHCSPLTSTVTSLSCSISCQVIDCRELHRLTSDALQCASLLLWCLSVVTPLQTLILSLAPSSQRDNSLAHSHHLLLLQLHVWLMCHCCLKPNYSSLCYEDDIQLLHTKPAAVGELITSYP